MHSKDKSQIVVHVGSLAAPSIVIWNRVKLMASADETDQACSAQEQHAHESLKMPNLMNLMG
eukprot:1327024-Amphidinium_carterae.4